MALLRNSSSDFLLIPAIVGVAAFARRLGIERNESQPVIHPVPENPATSTNGKP